VGPAPPSGCERQQVPEDVTPITPEQLFSRKASLNPSHQAQFADFGLKLVLLDDLG